MAVVHHHDRGGFERENFLHSAHLQDGKREDYRELVSPPPSPHSFLSFLFSFSPARGTSERGSWPLARQGESGIPLRGGGIDEGARLTHTV